MNIIDVQKSLEIFAKYVSHTDDSFIAGEHDLIYLYPTKTITREDVQKLSVKVYNKYVPALLCIRLSRLL